MKVPAALRKETLVSWMPYALALAGAFLYLIQALRYAHSTIPGLDEGSYLLKGYLYLNGVYEPFEPYGPLTNKAPLAFLIPGFAQHIFGAGLRTGRYFAIFLGLLSVLGTWITTRRWAGNWLAALSVWAFALSSMMIKIQAIAASEVIVASMLAWICVLVLAEERSAWQVVLGLILAALAVLTRQNMVFVLPLLTLYVFWQHGWRKGVAALTVGTVVFLSVHIRYWPHILTIWAPWLPESMTPFLDPFRLPPDAIPRWNPSNDFWNRLIAFFQGIRYHFVPAIGGTFSLFFLSFRRDWKTNPVVKASLFLAVLYFALFAMHAWAAVASRYESYSCVYCFTPYLTFFDPLGIILSAVTVSCLRKSEIPWIARVIAALLLLIVAVGVGLSSFDNIGPSVLNLPAPRMRDGWFLPGSTTLADLVSNKFGVERLLVKRYVASTMGLVAGLAAFLIALIIFRREKNDRKPAFTFVALNVFLAMSLLFSPLLNMGGSRRDCPNDVILANEQLGAHLAKVIPPNSLVYWDGGLSFTPMVYVPQARIFPPQINDGYTYRTGGDTDTIFRFSHWNAELRARWVESAGVFIIESRRYASWKEFLSPQEFEEYQRPPADPSCEDGSGLRIFHRLP